MECSLGRAEWMCQESCMDCEHAVFYDYDRPNFKGRLSIKPMDRVQVYKDGKPAKAAPVRVRVMGVVPVVGDTSD